MSNMRGFDAAQRAYDNMTPPDDGPSECDNCSGFGHAPAPGRSDAAAGSYVMSEKKSAKSFSSDPAASSEAATARLTDAAPEQQESGNV